MPESVNPYIAGSPITGSEMFFGREDVFEFVKRTLSGKHRDNVIVLYGQRRTGKTSVLYHIGRHLDPDYLCIFVDLHALALNGVSGLLWELANYIIRGLRRDYAIEVPRPDRTEFMADARDYFRNEFLGTVKAAIGSQHLLLMLDEVGRLHEKIQAGELETNVFEYLRHLMQHYDWLDFLYSLGSSLEEMQQDYSLLFSVALYKQISFLGREPATDLITKPVQDHYKIESAGVDRILEITSGHPYYTQLTCHCIFSRWQQKPTDSMGVRDVEDELHHAIELGSANLKFTWEQSSSGEKVVMAGLAACPASRSRIRDLQSAWSRLDVTLPKAEIARAVRSLIARDIIAGDEQYRFAVGLQRLWIKQQRRLDWVKEEVSADLPKWREAIIAERKTRRQRIARTIRVTLAGVILAGIVVTGLWRELPHGLTSIHRLARSSADTAGHTRPFEVRSMMVFLQMLVTAPEPLSWLLQCAAVGMLLIAAWMIAYLVAVVHANASASWRELLVTTTRVKISWIWGWSVACFVLLLWVASLGYLERVASWYAALPYLTTALSTLGIAAWLRRSVRAKVVTIQKLVQGGRR